MNKGNIVKWKNSGDSGIVVEINGNFAKIRYNIIDDDTINRKISDWIPISELEIIQE